MSTSKKKQKEKIKVFEEFVERNKNEIEFTNKTLGSGAYSQIKEVKMKDKIYAAKLISINESKGRQEIELYLALKGPNIIKINKIFEENYQNKTYDLVLMDKAILRDLGKLIEYSFTHNLLKLKFFPFFVKMSDNITRFYVKQIIYGLETLDRNDCVHFDLKPENILVTHNLAIKLSDFSLTKDLNKFNDFKKDENMFKIPGGTKGYLTPEYFLKSDVDKQTAKSQDFFALGATIYFIKFGKVMFKYPKFDEKDQEYDRIVDLYRRYVSSIKSEEFNEFSFNSFLCSLIHPKAELRPDFEHIYRNKWVNKNGEMLDTYVYIFENDEEKLIMELQKSDFIQKKEIDININERIIKNLVYKKNIENEKPMFIYSKNKFVFKRKDKKYKLKKS